MSEPDYKTELSGPVQGSVVGANATVTMIFHNGDKRTIELFRLFDPIDERRIDADDWKCLHKDFQDISSKMVHVRGAVANEDLKWALKELEDLWSFECRELILRFIELDGLPDRKVRQEFIQADEKRRWLAQIKENALALDGAIGKCKQAEALRDHLGEILAVLLRLERISSQLLSFLDSQLQRVIKELDTFINEARKSLTEPPSLQATAPS